LRYRLKLKQAFDSTLCAFAALRETGFLTQSRKGAKNCFCLAREMMNKHVSFNPQFEINIPQSATRFASVRIN
jgi:hypothetical protein